LGIRGAGELTPNALQAEYAKASGVVFASSEDNAPGVLVEAAMCGLPVISLNTQMTHWLSRDGFPTYGLDEVRGMKQFDEIASGYRAFLAGRQPNAVAREYEKLYTSL
jgi:glycosyltransferase involved in cell wall biosynthesis